MRKELNGLQWLDIVTGQGDRHAHNYLIDVREDLTVTGIDNDQCFTGYRTEAQTYVIKDRYAERFLEALEETIAKYPKNWPHTGRSHLNWKTAESTCG